MTFDPPIPATSVNGTDQYLIVGLEGTECIVIDQDGDLRPVFITELKTKYRYHPKQEVWYSMQIEAEEEAEDEQ